MIIEVGKHRILVDPMLGTPGSILPFSAFRRPPRLNPLVPLPGSAQEALEDITAALITHCRYGHKDHLDKAGEALLKRLEVPVFGPSRDTGWLRKRCLEAKPLPANDTQSFFDGEITTVSTRHGHGILSKIMGPGLGYLLEFPDEPSLYICGDTVLTKRVRQAVEKYQPALCVVAAGGARLDVGKPILMSMQELIEFVSLAPGKVIANHMEALNHCSITRESLIENAAQAGLSHKLIVPLDGQRLQFGTCQKKDG